MNVALLLLALLISYFLGGLNQLAALGALGFCYNDLGWGDYSLVTRNLLNAGGFVCFITSALKIAADIPFSILVVADTLTTWLAVIAVVIFSTINVQDMQDQLGDSLRERRTLPIIAGDGPARLLIAFPVISWSWLCPRFWNLNWTVALPFITLGHAITIYTCAKRETKDDRITFFI